MFQVSPALLSKAVLATLAVCAVVGLLAGRVRRRLRITPDQATSAPLSWLTGLHAEARVHRRIRAAARRVSPLRRGPGTSRRSRRGARQRLARDLLEELILLDERLIEFSKGDQASVKQGVKMVRGDLDRLESLIDRLTVLVEEESAAPSPPETTGGIDDLTARLVRLEEVADTRRVIDTSGHDTPSHALGQGDDPSVIDVPVSPPAQG